MLVSLNSIKTLLGMNLYQQFSLYGNKKFVLHLLTTFLSFFFKACLGVLDSLMMISDRELSHSTITCPPSSSKLSNK